MAIRIGDSVFHIKVDPEYEDMIRSAVLRAGIAITGMMVMLITTILGVESK